MQVKAGTYVSHKGKTFYVKSVDDFFVYSGGGRSTAPFALCKEVDGDHKPVKGKKAVRYAVDRLTATS